MSFLIGVANYDENLTQGDKQDLLHEVDEATEQAIQKVREHLAEQDNYMEAIHDEMCGAKEYALKYIEYKTSKSDWARMYEEMAEAELKHAEYLKQMAQEYFDGLAWKSEESKIEWEHCKAKMVEKAALVKMILSV